jgi:hypothetical protein
MTIPFDNRHRRTEADFAERHPGLYDRYRTPRLLLLPALKGEDELPKEAWGRVIVASVKGMLHFRIFEGGEITLNVTEQELKKRFDRTKERKAQFAEGIKALRSLLEPLWSQHLSVRVEDAVLHALTPLVGDLADCRWRTIDFDWAEPAASFALQLDNKTNNTSLAFALEIGAPGEGKVLLFPGDAQVGNWLSWFGPVKVLGETEPVGVPLEWKVGDKVVKAEDLMRRTEFYKVGHHGSHNGTLRARDKQPCGVKLMTSKHLVAMIPIDEFVARKKAGYGDMPQPELVADLLEMTDGRVARNDEDAPYDKADAPVLKGVGLHGRKPEKTFARKRTNPLYIEYDITL